MDRLGPTSGYFGVVFDRPSTHSQQNSATQEVFIASVLSPLEQPFSGREPGAICKMQLFAPYLVL